MRSPIVLVPACVNLVGVHASHTAHLKYVAAVADGARCTPLIVPALGDATDFDTLLDIADGIMLTGSPSNVDAALYGQALLDPSLPRDPARDATTLPLIRAALERGIPLLAVCRGFQEVNVALGGTLHQSVHAVDGMHDHREQKGHTMEQQYASMDRWGALLAEEKRVRAAVPTAKWIYLEPDIERAQAESADDSQLPQAREQAPAADA